MQATVLEALSIACSMQSQASLVVSTLLPNANPTTQANVKIYNRAIPEVVRKRQADGKQIVYVDFSSSTFSLSDLSSVGTYPTDAGYLKIAEVWYQGIAAAKSRGWLSTLERGTSNAASGGSNNTVDTAPAIAPDPTIGPVGTQVGLGTTSIPAVSAILFLIFLQMVL